MTSLKKSGLQCRFMLCVALLYEYITLSTTVTTPLPGYNAKDIREFSARDFGRSLAHCFSVGEMSNCFKEELLHFLDVAAHDNSTWRYNDFVSFERKSTQESQRNINFQQMRQKRSFSDTLAEKLLHVAQTRSLQLTLPKELSGLAGISNAVDDVFFNEPSKPTILTSFTEEGTVRVFNGLVEDKIEAISYSGHKKKKKKKKKKVKEIKDKNKKKKSKIWYLNNKNPLKGRKKKDKDKNMAMMGGMAMMAMVAQMFLGKVILIAGAAFIMAKIALLVSVLGSLKKGTGGSSGSTTEHIVISGGGGGGGGGHSHDSGWHRSMPYEHVKVEPISEEHSSVSSPQIVTEEYNNSGPSSLSINDKSFQPTYYTLRENDDQQMPIFL